jgi:pre-mRNA-splicing helicase BRR2
MQKDEVIEAQKALERVPLVDMNWTLVAVDQKNEPLEGELLEEGGEAQLVVHLRRVNSANS